MGKQSKIAPNVLGNSILSLEILKDTSNVISAVPLVGAVLAAAIGVLKAIERTNNSQTSCKRLAQRTSELVQYIEKRVTQSLDIVDADIVRNLMDISKILNDIHKDVEQESRRRYITRLLRNSSISDKVNEYNEALDFAWRSFDICCLLSIDRRLRLDMRFDHNQDRIFRPSDLSLLEVCNDWHPADGCAGSVMLAKWQHRLVVVRVVQGNSTKNLGASDVSMSSPRINHPRIARVLGYSHPAIPEKFYVVETERLSLAQCVGRITDTKMLLRVWMQTLYDFEDAFEYAERSALKLKRCIWAPRSPQTSDNHAEPSLSTARMDSNYRVLLTMDDLGEGRAAMSLFWLAYYANRLYWDHMVPRAGIVCEQAILEECLLALSDSGCDPAFCLGKLYRQPQELYIASPTPVTLGDYGYMSEDRRFVRLGNISDLILDNNTCILWERREYDRAEGVRPSSCQAVRCLHLETDDSTTSGHAEWWKYCKLEDWCLKLFWDHIIDIASQYNREIHDLTILTSIYPRARANWLRQSCPVDCSIHEQSLSGFCCHTERSTFGDPSRGRRESRLFGMGPTSPATSVSAQLVLNVHFNNDIDDVTKFGSCMYRAREYRHEDPEQRSRSRLTTALENLPTSEGCVAGWHSLSPLEGALLAYMKGQDQLHGIPAHPRFQNLTGFKTLGMEKCPIILHN